MLTLGLILSFGVGSIHNFPYYHVALVAIGIVVIFEICMIWLPDTPFSLLSRGQLVKAKHSLMLLRRKDSETESELNEIKEFVSSIENKRRCINFWRPFLKKGTFIPLVYMLMMVLFLQIGGGSVVVSYAATIFSDAGSKNPRTTAVYAIGLASLLGNVVMFSTVDLLGRKPLLILGSVGMIVGSAMLGTHFVITRPSLCLSLNTTSFNELNITSEIENMTDADNTCNRQYIPLAIISLFLFRFACSVGWSPLIPVLFSELFPLRVRGSVSGIIILFNSLTAATVDLFYFPYSQLVQPWFATWTLSAINLAGAIFVLVFIPETKGKSLEELERLFSKRTPHLCISCSSLQKTAKKYTE